MLVMLKAYAPVAHNIAESTAELLGKIGICVQTYA